MKIIKLTDKYDRDIYINAMHIVCFWRMKLFERTAIVTINMNSPSEPWEVKEPPIEIFNRIRA